MARASGESVRNDVGGKGGYIVVIGGVTPVAAIEVHQEVSARAADIKWRRIRPTPSDAPVVWVAVRDADEGRGWYGPLPLDRAIQPDVTGTLTTEHARPTAAAIDCAGWDLRCRREGIPLWRAVGLAQPGAVTHYGSALGLRDRDLHAAAACMAEWETIKVSVNRPDQAGIGGAVAAAFNQWIERREFALDLHGATCKVVDELLRATSGGLRWLEDPTETTSAQQGICIVRGEHAGSAGELAAIAAQPEVGGIQFEPSRLGISGALTLMRVLPSDLLVFVHGHVPSAAVAVASALGRSHPTLVEHSLPWRTQRTPDGADRSDRSVPRVGLGPGPRGDLNLVSEWTVTRAAPALATQAKGR